MGDLIDIDSEEREEKQNEFDFLRGFVSSREAAGLLRSQSKWPRPPHAKICAQFFLCAP